MKVKSKFALVMAACMVLALFAGTAIAYNGDGNTIVQVSAASVDGNDFMSNDADIDVDTDDEDAAAAACANQLNSAVNGVLVLVATTDTLGLIEDEDALLATFPDFLSMQDQTNVEVDHHNQNATATCKQTVGSIRIIDDPVSGWGETPPQGDAWGDLFGQSYLGGGSNENTIVQVAAASAQADDVMGNDLDLDVDADDDDSAAAGCANQMNLVANGVFVGVATATAEAAIIDNDFTNITFDDGRNDGGNGPILGAQQDQTNVEANHHNRTATATCTQTLESYELFIGGEGKDSFPPLS